MAPPAISARASSATSTSSCSKRAEARRTSWYVLRLLRPCAAHARASICASRRSLARSHLFPLFASHRPPRKFCLLRQHGCGKACHWHSVQIRSHSPPRRHQPRRRPSVVVAGYGRLRDEHAAHGLTTSPTPDMIHDYVNAPSPQVIDGDYLFHPKFNLKRVVESAMVRGKDTLTWLHLEDAASQPEHSIVEFAGAITVNPKVTLKRIFLVARDVPMVDGRCVCHTTCRTSPVSDDAAACVVRACRLRVCCRTQHRAQRRPWRRGPLCWCSRRARCRYYRTSSPHAAPSAPWTRPPRCSRGCPPSSPCTPSTLGERPSGFPPPPLPGDLRQTVNHGDTRMCWTLTQARGSTRTPRVTKEGARATRGVFPSQPLLRRQDGRELPVRGQLVRLLQPPGDEGWHGTGTRPSPH
jgi:hypothetical protein